MFLLMLACAKPVPPATPFLPPFPKDEPPERTPLQPAEGDCERAEVMKPGVTASCHGVLVPNADLFELRLGEADRVFWEDTARGCWRSRETDRVACNAYVTVLQQNEVVLREEVRRRAVVNQVAFPLGVLTGAGAAVLLAFALEEARN